MSSDVTDMLMLCIGGILSVCKRELLHGLFLPQPLQCTVYMLHMR
jgi:hypothetical protein